MILDIKSFQLFSGLKVLICKRKEGKAKQNPTKVSVCRRKSIIFNQYVRQGSKEVGDTDRKYDFKEMWLV